jgi:hypothetical protein
MYHEISGKTTVPSIWQQCHRAVPAPATLVCARIEPPSATWRLSGTHLHQAWAVGRHAEAVEDGELRRLHGARRARGTSLCPGHILLFGHVNILSLLS